MDIFQEWVDLWSPIATPTADLGAEALRKYQAGEIDFGTYQAATLQNASLLDSIFQAKSDYAGYAAKNSLDPISGLVVPAINFGSNLITLAVIVGTIYLLANWKKIVKA